MDTATLAGACGCEIVYPTQGAAITHKSVLKDISQVGSLKKVRVEDFRYVENWLEISRRVAEYFKNEKYVRCNCDQAAFSLASMLRDSQEFMVDLLDEDYEEEVMELIHYCTDITTQFLRLAAQTGAHGLSNGDSVAGPSMISPGMYEQFAFPFEKQIAEAVHREGVDYLLHICGDTSVILNKLRELPVDAFELDYKTDVQNIYDAFSDKITLSGNIDPSGVLHSGSEEEVRRATEQLLQVYQDSTRLIVCSGCALPPDTPEGNMRALIDTVRRSGIHA